MNLTAKFSVFIAILVFSLVSIITAVFIVVRIEQIRSDLISEANLTSVLAAQDFSNSFADYYFYQYDTYRTFVRGKLQEYNDIVHFTMYGVNGDILFDSEQLNSPSGSTPPAIEKVTDPDTLRLIAEKSKRQDTTTWDRQSVIRVVVPYIDGYNVYRNLFIFQFSTQKISDAIRQTIVYYSLGLIVFITVGMGITYVLVRQIIHPVVELTRAATNFPNSSFDFTNFTKSKDEIGMLAVAFGKMARDLAVSHKQLEKQNQTLEQEVDKRTKELQLKIQEMEKLQKITIDRELKMIEMKNELDKLKQEKSIT